MAVAHINGVDLYYEMHGSGETVFLTHGSWGDATGWQAVVPDLAKRFEIVVWDRRGHTRSSAGHAGDTIDDDANDLAALIGYLDRSGAHVYGSSSGGAVVLKLLSTRPDLVSTAAVHEPAVPGLLHGIGDGDTVRLLEEMNRHLDQVRTMIENGEDEPAAAYFMEHVAVGPGAWENFPRDVRRTFIANAKTYAGELSDPTAFVVDTDTLATSDTPLLVTLGTDSPPLLLAATREFIRRVPCARVETLEGSGHVPYRTHPDLWRETLLAFYDDVARDRTGLSS